MYRHILIAIENSEADRAVLNHVEPLARLTGAKLLLVHVADGWAARAFEELKLRESEEMRQDREYLARICEELVQRGFQARARLAMGDPATNDEGGDGGVRRPPRDVHTAIASWSRPDTWRRRSRQASVRSCPDGAGGQGARRRES
jgi:hypothetical protein